MRRAQVALIALVIAACATPLEVGERLYREGDRLGALEVWRAALEQGSDHPAIPPRIAEVEEESDQLVERSKKSASYFEGKGRLAESILHYRLALKLQPDDAPALAHVQELARELATRKAELEATYRVSFGVKNLAPARDELERLRTLDPFDPEIESEERRLQDELRAEVKDRLARGKDAFDAGDHAAARGAFDAVIKLEPDNESARRYLSGMATIRRESQVSREEPVAFEAPEALLSDAEIRAEGFDPLPQFFYKKALEAERRGDYYGAIHLDGRALGADPGHSAARSHLAEMRRLVAGEVEGLIEQGRDYFRNEDLQRARDSWRLALLIDPDNERAKAYLERAERQLENLERLRWEPPLAGGRD